MLALGATRYEAALPLIQKAFSTAMTPLLNMMNLVGLVSIPGMMTGQLLSGAYPMQAALYQVRQTRRPPPPAACRVAAASWPAMLSLLLARACPLPLALPAACNAMALYLPLRARGPVTQTLLLCPNR